MTSLLVSTLLTLVVAHGQPATMTSPNVAHRQSATSVSPHDDTQSRGDSGLVWDRHLAGPNRQVGSLSHKEPCTAASASLASALASRQASQPATSPSVRFAAVDVYVDSGVTPLAAYQLEITAVQGDVKIVGIEGGEHAAFKIPPYYDPAAMMNHRVILAAFNTGSELPAGKSRVARVHVQVSGDVTPQYACKLVLAAASDGQRMAATASVEGVRE
jgi:hypothetical protein